MLSLSILVVAILVTIPLTAWALVWSARAVGSPRGRFRVGLRAVFLMMGIGIAILTVSARLQQNHVSPLVFNGAMLVMELGVFLLVLSWTFDLSLGRAFAPLTAYLALAIAQVLLAWLVIKPFVIEAFVFPTRSMMPTINPGDRFCVNKLSRPRRWDLVAYRVMERGHSVVYCKRLIGLPGERLRFAGGMIYVNEELMEVPAIIKGRCRAAPAGVRPESVRYAEGEIIPLGGNEYFFMGDNVDLSGDSRLAGPSDGSSLVGVVDLMYWPPAKFRIVR